MVKARTRECNGAFKVVVIRNLLVKPDYTRIQIVFFVFRLLKMNS